MPNRAFPLVSLVALVVVSLACGSSSAAVEQVKTAIPAAEQPVQLPVATTSEPPTAQPALTLEPLVTPTPPPEPLQYKGTRDDVLALKKRAGPAILHISSTRNSGNFSVWSVDQQGNKTDLLVNTIGAYDGYRLIDMEQDENTYRLEISSPGAWTVDIYPIAHQYLHILNVPGHYDGLGDDVVFVNGNADLATFDYPGNRNFAVWSHGGQGRDLLVNEIGPYKGKVLVPPDTLILAVDAVGK